MNTGYAAEVVADPVAVIVGLVTSVEQDLGQGAVLGVVTRVAGGRAKRRRLAQALTEEPARLATGGPPVPWAVGQLLLGLRAAGATRIALPCCGDCGPADHLHDQPERISDLLGLPGHPADLRQLRRAAARVHPGPARPAAM